jgi:hypothetical protein
LKLLEYQELAKSRGIEITKIGVNGKVKAKTREELYNELVANL